MLSVNPGKRTVTVEHANMIKRHTRAESVARTSRAASWKRKGPSQISNVLLVCPACNKHARVGHKALPDGTKVRVCRRCGTTLEK